jgi:hypothetical protein
MLSGRGKYVLQLCNFYIFVIIKNVNTAKRWVWQDGEFRVDSGSCGAQYGFMGSQ